MEPMPEWFDAWLTSGPEEEDVEVVRCECDRCMGDPEDDSDIYENIKTREGVREPWVGA